MAKKGNRINIVMVEAETGHTYHTTKNKTNTSGKLEVKKYNPKLRKHLTYKEKK